MIRTLKYMALAFLLILIIFPIFYVISASFFQSVDFTTTPAPLFSSKFTLNNYVKALSHNYFPTFIFNSILTGLLATILRTSIALLAAFSFSHFKFKGRNFLFSVILLTLFIPSDALLLPNFLTVQKMGLIDSYLGIIITSLLAPANILMLRQFFFSIPKDFHYLAQTDGLSDFKYFSFILIPLSKALISTLALQSFVTVFNAYLWPLLVTNKMNMRTVQIGFTMLGFTESMNYGALSASITIVLIPFLITFILMKKRIMKALNKGYLFT